MSKIPPDGWKEVDRILRKFGWTFVPGRGKGSHRLHEKADRPRPIIVPAEKTLARGTLLNIIKTSGIPLEDYLRELSPR
jgi:predicted RNA binding protein YcfA (HicA-like mRNA interferase family)